ncbi:cyclin-dependent kinase G-2-like [Gastrolobium bilobum]|uniref:cyclin-dependent kinase G-2-like n=1 Tax=Gastrolobium bilobum TaxID=150636 RepID=UPI002AB1885F|nr:cyclin-dependent kinase G-2-like [Gastrolobium bilobum]
MAVDWTAIVGSSQPQEGNLRGSSPPPSNPQQWLTLIESTTENALTKTPKAASLVSTFRSPTLFLAGQKSVLLRKECYKFDHSKNGSSIKEFDGSCNNHVTRSGRNGFRGGKEGREQGELCVERGEYARASGFLAGDVDEALPPPEKRRKISPIVWDLAEKEGKIPSKGRVKQVTAVSPSLPSLSSSPGAKGVLRLTSSNSSYVLPQEHSQKHNQDVDEENDVQGRNIKMSKWFYDDLSPRDANDEYKHGKGSQSPETGEFRRDSDSTITTSSGSSGTKHYLGRSIDDSYSKKEFLIDSMDEVEVQSNVSDSPSDSDANGGLIHMQRNTNMLQSSRSVCEFEMIKKINEGTYGVVYKAKDKKTGEIVALKKVKMNLERDGFPLSALREMNILLSSNHPSIVDVKEVVVDDFDGTFMVMEYMEYDLKGLMEVKKQPFSIGEIKSLMMQLLQGVKYLHDNWVLHRDLKTSNILLNKDGELKICDFGLSRQYGSSPKPYTPVVVTLWYRAPELLLGAKEYSTAIDMWSVGCIMAELVAKEPLFRGKTELEQLDKIFRTLGTPNEKIWPGLSKLPRSKVNFVKQPYNMLRKKFPAASFTGSHVLSELGFDLLKQLLNYDPEKRITAEAALLHDWFQEAPLPKSDFKHIFPSWR